MKKNSKFSNFGLQGASGLHNCYFCRNMPCLLDMCLTTISGCVPQDARLVLVDRIGITPMVLVPLNDSFDADVIALSDRPWLIQAVRHSLSCISISFQPSTCVTPVCSPECPKGLLFVAENSLHLVRMFLLCYLGTIIFWGLLLAMLFMFNFVNSLCILISMIFCIPQKKKTIGTLTILNASYPLPPQTISLVQASIRV